MDNVTFLYPLKTENLKYSDVFRGVWIYSMGGDELSGLLLTLNQHLGQSIQ